MFELHRDDGIVYTLLCDVKQEQIEVIEKAQ